LTGRLFKKSSNPTGGGIVIDLGTGDGRFVYQSARRNPNKFYIGIDPSPRPLAKISEKIHRRPEKGGVANVLFIQAAVEDLPIELDGVADEVHVHFPWGSLLRAVAAGEEGVLANLRRICAPDALLEVLIALDTERDRSEIGRLGLGPLTNECLESVRAPRYRAAGFEVSETGVLPPEKWPSLHSSWAERLRGRAGRPLVYLIARAVT
jgi:16S rRNA (adenine(1408)-N(1))-methyltransferase